MEVVKCENENYNSDNHDVDIILGNKVFKVHSEVLSENSDYFKTRLSSSNKDVHARPVTFEFADAQPTPAAMETVLNFLYDGKITLSSSSVREILETARLLTLRHPSFESTMIGYLDLENWYTFLEASRAFEFEAMLEDIRQFASDHFYLVSSTTEYNLLEDSEKADITSKIMTKGKYMHSTVSAVLLHRTEDGERDSGNVVCCYDEKAKDWLFLGKGFHSDSERFNSDPIFYGASTHKHIMCYSESSQNGSVTVKSFNTKTNSLKTYVSSTEEILQGYGITSTDGSKFYQIASRITKGKLPIILVYGDASNTSPLDSQIITVTFSKESLVFGEARDNIKNNIVDACSFNESLYLLVQQEIIKKGMNRSVFQGILVEISISSNRSTDADIGVKVDREIIISSSMSVKPMLRILCNDDLNVLVVAEDEATLSKYRDGEVTAIWQCHDFPTTSSRSLLTMIGDVVYAFDALTCRLRYFDVHEDSAGALKLPSIVTKPWHVVKIAKLDVPEQFPIRGKILAEVEMIESTQPEAFAELAIDETREEDSATNPCFCFIYPLICCCFPCLAFYVYCVEHRPLKITDFRRVVRVVHNLLCFPCRVRRRIRGRSAVV